MSIFAAARAENTEVFYRKASYKIGTKELLVV